MLLLFAIAISSCSTKKNSATRRAFHNLTSHYNTYWNGNEAFEQGMRELQKQIKINYTEILPVEDYGTLQQAQAINSQMDRAIEKASKVVQKHSMFFERKEQVRRVPDSYMLLGKAYFYKQDYYNARQTFEYVAQRYERQPIRFKSHIWQARTAIRLREFERSITILDNLQNQSRRSDFPKELIPEIPVVYALHYTNQLNYQAAKPHLRKAAELNRDKNISARMYYILGQIHQQENDFATANQHYARVINLNPSYEMKFSAMIRRAECFDASRGSSRGIVADLNKLLKDTKNKEYHDQIYYALALVAERENNDSASFRLLRLSVSTSVSNDFQKALSARKLADKYFAIPEYTEAHTYYDTTFQLLAIDHPDYAELERKTATLKELVGYLDALKFQDSLQMLANLPEAERNKIVDKIIAEYKAEQDRIKKEEEQLARAERPAMPMPGRDPSRGMLQQVSGGGWYFYNPQAITYGTSDFMRKWGRRKLEDNWRLSDKRTYASFDSGDLLAAEGDTLSGDKEGQATGDPMKRETYLSNIPTTPEMLEASNAVVADAMYKTGYVFREGLRDYPKSEEAFEAFLTRFPGHTKELDALYHLYTMSTIDGKTDRAADYKRMILNRYPDSEYAAILSDPEYFTRLEANKRKAESLYEDTYVAYKNNQYRMVLIYSNEAQKEYPDSKLLPKFDFLKTLSLGGLHNQDTLTTHLKKFIASHSSSELVPVAQAMLANFGVEGFEPEVVMQAGEDQKPVEAPSIYTYAPNDNHFFVLVINHSRGNIDASKVRISDFNSNNYRIDNLTVNAVILDLEYTMISVSNFKGRDRAMAYYNAIVASDYVLSPQLRSDSHYFAISSENYPIFYRDKVIDTYMQFFRKHYLKK